MYYKTSRLLILILILLILFSACQPTPKEQPVVQKGDLEQTIINKTTQTLQPSLTQQPQSGTIEEIDKTEPAFTWKDEYIDKKGIFKVKIDAEVIMPDVTAFPAARMALCQFSDEQLGKAVKTFFDDSSIYDGNIPPTKSELAESIIKIKAQQQDPNTRIDEDYLEYLEDAYKDAPEKTELKQTEPVWKGSDDNRQINIIQKRDGGERASIRGISSEKERCFIEFSSKSEQYVPAEKLNGQPNGVSITLEEAEEIVSKTAAQLGFEDYMIVSEVAGGLLDMDPRYIDPNNPSKEKQCYIFYLSKPIGSIPFTYVMSAGGDFMTDGKPYAPPVFQETIEVQVNDSGVIYFRWDNPYEQTEYVSDNVELLDFEEIKSIFLKQMKREGEGRNEWYPTNGKTDDTINIDKVELGMMVTIDKDAPDRFISIPVWDFFAPNYDIGNKVNYSILTVNAIDGSIINRNLGY